MTGLETFALVAVSVWLAVLTVGIVLTIRQVAILTVRADHDGSSVPQRSLAERSAELEREGPIVGSLLANDVTAELPTLQNGRRVLLVLSASCNPCREIAQRLQDRWTGGASHIVALLPGERERADELAKLLPPDLELVRDPQARRIATSLGFQSVPAAVEVENGIVTRKAPLPILKAEDLTQFLNERSAPVAEITDRRITEVASYAS